MQLWLAIRAFFAVLFDRDAAAAIRGFLSSETAEARDRQPSEPRAEPPRQEPAAAATGRNDAITLLASLQREARFVDIIQEQLADYTDQQIGAAARDVLRDCRTVLDRMFALEPVVDAEEGAQWEVPAGFDTDQFRLTGNVVGEPPFRGQVVHHGWQATRCELPTWTGRGDAARVVAPAEVEIRN